jgi:predicted ATPase
LEVAERAASTFAEGVFFVPLAGIRDADRVADKILEALPDHVVDAAASTEDHLIDYIARRSVLLVLDNFEHVIEAAPVAVSILQASPGTKIVATSRSALRVAGEQEMPIPPLAIPEPEEVSAARLAEFDSIALFVDRATAVRPSFQLDDETAPVVSQLVARLDGLPLAIELAASRLRTFSVGQILANLSQVMASGGRRDLPLRQQTMHNAIAWSFDLLPESSKKLLADLSVFAGGACLEEIEAVAGAEHGDALLGALETLVEHSLVIQTEVAGVACFRLLETVRQFGRDQLADDELAVLRERHARTFAALVGDAEPHLTGPGSGIWLDRLSISHDNIRAAQQWALENGYIDTAYEVASSLWRFFHMRGFLFTARELLEDLLQVEGASATARAKALEAAGGVAYWSGDMKKSQEFYEEALELLRQLGDRGPIAYGLYNLAFARGYLGHSEEARGLLDQARAVFVDLGDGAGVAAATWGIGDAWAASGDLAEARLCFEQSIASFEELDDPFGLGWALYTQGEVLIRLHDYEAARDHLVRGMQLFDGSDISALVMYLAVFAALAIAQGDEERGVRLAGAMAGLRDETGTNLVRVGMSTAAALDPEALGLMEGELVDVYDAGRAMSAAAARAYALEI